MACILRIGESMSSLRAAVVLLLALASLLTPSDARACGGAILLDLDQSAANLAEAEEALETGDLRYAHALAVEVLASDSDLFVDRAHRIEALALARDPGADEADLTGALEALSAQMSAADKRTPSLEADFAETAARIPRYRDDARRQLLSLADRDLMGSAYAYAALARLADAHGDAQVAGDARTRCRTMAIDPGVCGPELRRPALLRLHGRPLGYFGPAMAALALLAFRLLRERRARRTPGTAPWIGYGAPVQVAVLALGAAHVIARARSPYEVLLVMLGAGILTIVAERRAFLAAVRRGRVPGFRLRAATPEDSAPRIALHFGPRAEEVLERIDEDAPTGGYRVAARTALLRLARRPLRRTVGAALALVVLVAVVGSLFATLTAPRAPDVMVRAIAELPNG